MELFGESHDRLLLEYKAEECLFDEIQNSTSCVDGNFSGVEFMESDFTEILEATSNIPIIDSNYGHKRLDGFVDPTIRPKSNRGRKPKIKVKKTRKVQGDGSTMNSCIQFTIFGMNPNTDAIKKYLIKVFRNGRFQIPGVLSETMDDVIGPLEIMRSYLAMQFIDPVNLLNISSTMRNYKFKLLDGKIDIRALYQYCIDHFTILKNISLDDLTRLMLLPIFNTGLYHPHDFESWNEVIESNNMDYVSSLSEFKLDVNEIISNLIYSNTLNKGTLVDINKLANWLNLYDPCRIYQTFVERMIALCNSYVQLTPKTTLKLLECMMAKTLVALRTLISTNNDNQVAGFKLDTEKYAGLLIYVKTPLPNDPDKRTTVKIFPSGKINIDGANNRSDALDIYWWLNHILVNNKQFIYANDYIHDGSDDEFSESDEEVIAQPNINALIH
jgi:hypothetical protein